MTPKEKAEELINRYIGASVVVVGSEEYYHEKPFTLAQQCALIAVDEFIKNGCSIFYWQQVKNEIEQL